MSRWPMLLLRGTTWYYRRAVPAKLRPLLGGRRQIWKSLRSADYDQAKLLSLQVGQEVERELQALERRVNGFKQASAVSDPVLPEQLAQDCPPHPGRLPRGGPLGGSPRRFNWTRLRGSRADLRARGASQGTGTGSLTQASAMA
jgi:hypothetical protein